MTCMDIINKLEGSDRFKCWQLFMKLSRVFFVKDKQDDKAVTELRSVAEEMNGIFIKKGFVSHFNTELDDKEFINQLLTEMDLIKNGNKLKD